MMIGKVIGKRTILLLAMIAAALMFSSGVALAASITCQVGVDCLGTKNADSLLGTDGNDYMHGRGGGDTLKGFGDNDSLHGEGGNDMLQGGPGDDGLVGGNGQDTQKGGESNDAYYFGPGWGKDSISDRTGTNRLVFHGAPIGSLPVTEDLTIKLVSGDGPEVTNANGSSTINWDDNAIRNVEGSSGDDDMVGNNLGNIFYGGYGEDTISSGGGDDFIYVDGDSYNDHVDCGSNLLIHDHDTVYANSTDVVASNCEEVHTLPES